uniref:Uncharacterized protein n=1 Tax=Physcomitrium patens TaxID=3218 RepID=A0A2K1JXA4_PHYPA|nr:hypothetical protein PHYPA_013273 [Physcomitrium patens]
MLIPQRYMQPNHPTLQNAPQNTRNTDARFRTRPGRHGEVPATASARHGVSRRVQPRFSSRQAGRGGKEGSLSTTIGQGRQYWMMDWFPEVELLASSSSSRRRRGRETET